MLLTAPTTALYIYILIPLSSHCYSTKCISPQGSILREYWKILWAGSSKYVSRCKYQITEQCVVCYVTVVTWQFDKYTRRITHCSLDWYLYLDTCVVDSVHKMYQYSLRMNPWALKHVGVYSVIKVVIPYICASCVSWTVHHLDSWIKRDQLHVTCFIISLFNAQHVSDANTSIHEITQQISHKLLRMDVLISETCWAWNNEIIKQVTSSWYFFI